MRNFWKAFLALAVISSGVALWAPGPGASSEHFVVTNDNRVKGENEGTVWKLNPGQNPSLSVATDLHTGGTNLGGGGVGMNETAIIRHGSDICVFISDNDSGDIASFTAPTYAEVGRFPLPGTVPSDPGIGLAARQEFLFASYVNDSDGIAYILTWRIGSGCTLSLTSTYAPPGQVWGMSISPNGQTLVVSYSVPSGTIDSFSVGTDGSLTEHGPYDYYFLYLSATGIDITADGKYAVIGEFSYGTPPNDVPYTEVGIYPINADGSLGGDIDFGGNGYLGLGVYSAWVRLSPDERFVFVSSDSFRGSITTLTFNESAPAVGYACIKRRPASTEIGAFGLTTILPTGSGRYLAQSESGLTNAALGLFSIDSSTGCLTEAPSSPYTVGKNSGLSSVVSWPPRPF